MRGLKAMYLRCSNYASYKEGGALLPMRVSISNVHRLFALLVWRPARYHAVGALQWAVLSPVSAICVPSLPASMFVAAGLDSPNKLRTGVEANYGMTQVHPLWGYVVALQR